MRAPVSSRKLSLFNERGGGAFRILRRKERRKEIRATFGAFVCSIARSSQRIDESAEFSKTSALSEAIETIAGKKNGPSVSSLYRHANERQTFVLPYVSVVTVTRTRTRANKAPQRSREAKTRWRCPGTNMLSPTREFCSQNSDGETYQEESSESAPSDRPTFAKANRNK